MHPVEALTRLGGVASTAMLCQATTPGQLKAARRRGEVIRVARGRYALPTADVGLRAAASLSGAASHLSAAAIRSWELAWQPERPAVVVPRNRKVEPARRHGRDVRWRDVSRAELAAHVTGPYTTVLDCARDLPFSAALAVADSALRHREVDAEELARRARKLKTNGRTACIRVADAATPLAANPFESVLRAIALGVPGLAVEPQVVIDERGFFGRPDLVDRRRRLVLEADSYSHHAGREAFARDCERYNALTIRGWTVLRFAWEHVLLRPEYVRCVLVWCVEGPDERAPLPPGLLWAG
jgi:very-short-patch-repair endonuclease